jgi:hypothetical protein
MSRLRVALLVLFATGCETSGFSDAYMALDSSGKREREYFFTDTEEIYCVGKLASGVDDLTVSVAIRAEQIYDPKTGAAQRVDYYLGTEDQAPGAGQNLIVSFKLEKSDTDAPYPAGRFVCEFSLDGELKERLPFEVRFPSCPEAPIVDGTICGGFVLEGARCNSAFSMPCTCGSDGVWQCR